MHIVFSLSFFYFQNLIDRNALSRAKIDQEEREREREKSYLSNFGFISYQNISYHIIWDAACLFTYVKIIVKLVTRVSCKYERLFAIIIIIIHLTLVEFNCLTLLFYWVSSFEFIAQYFYLNGIQIDFFISHVILFFLTASIICFVYNPMSVNGTNVLKYFTFINS